MPDLTNALVTEWTQIPTDTLQNLAERLTIRVQVIRTTRRDEIWNESTSEAILSLKVGSRRTVK